MAIGSVLLRPQLLTRTNTIDEERIGDQFFELAARLIQDFIANGAAKEKVSNTLQTSLQELTNEIEVNLKNSASKIQAWFDTIIDAIKDELATFVADNDISAIPNKLVALIKLITRLLEQVSTDQLATHLNKLGDIIEIDMGLSQARLTTFLNRMVDRAVSALAADYLAGQDTDEAKRCFLIAGYLQSLKSYLSSFLKDFTFDRKKLVVDLA
ncbi:MAG: hypothetical protein AB1489_40605, partial [Acidobacteriota bacterium]